MDQKLKRVLNTFALAFAGTLLLQVVANQADYTAALNTGNWHTLRALGFAAIAAAVLAGLRALQAYVPSVPSPEPDER